MTSPGEATATVTVSSMARRHAAMRRPIRRVAMLAVHTSPLAQPGSGDAGGMNVYVDQVARRMARRGLAVEVFTRATSSAQPRCLEVEPGYTVRHVLAGPFGGVAKEELPGLLCSFAASVLRAATPLDSGTRFDVVHSHYWLSGQVGVLLRDRWGIPLVHSAHTLARVKNAALAGDDDRREPRLREIGEQQVVADADLLVAPTEIESAQLVDLYDAAPPRVAVIPPGVDIDRFRPDPADRARVRAGLGVGADDILLVFAGRIQPHKGPEVLVRTVAELRRRYPGRPISAVLAGDSSGSGHSEPDRLRSLAAGLGVANAVRLRPAMAPAALAGLYRAADAVLVPSHSESFGLVALEAQACGTPVVAARVGGLPVAVADGSSGLLVGGYDAETWADAVATAVLDRARRARMSAAARTHAEHFSWDTTVDRLLDAYAQAATFSRVGVAAGLGVASRLDAAAGHGAPFAAWGRISAVGARSGWDLPSERGA